MLTFKTDLRGANLQGATFERNDFSEARLEGTDLRGTKIENVEFKATFDKYTQWPEGFDPEAKGAVRMDSNDE
jgi:uncharacterized protein YjbI with pentapeptide repeats